MRASAVPERRGAEAVPSADQLPMAASRLAGALAAGAVLLTGCSAGANEKIAEFNTSGLIFKDSVQVGSCSGMGAVLGFWSCCCMSAASCLTAEASTRPWFTPFK